MKIFRIFILMLIVFFVNACSFQSKQYNFLRNILGQKITESIVPNWVINWTGIKINIYAINSKNRIFFANYDHYFLVFDGWQIIRAEGFFPDKMTAEIKVSDSDLTYIVNKKIIMTDSCKPWFVSADETTDFMLYKQICDVTGTDYNYTNLIFINEHKEIIGLKYKLHPDYPSIQLNMNEYTDLNFNR